MVVEVYKQADSSMLDDLINIMEICFGNPRWFIEFVFEQKFDLNNCYICEINTKIVSLLHVIPVEIVIDNISLKSGYIYGACTLPEYRKNGYMTNLINYVHKKFSENDYDCLCLVPAEKKLQKFYKNLNYENFFKCKQIGFNKQDLTNYISNINNYKDFDSEPDFFMLNKFRDEFYKDKNYVKYNYRDLEFLRDLYEISDTGLVNIDNNYVFCTSNIDNELKLIDFTCEISKTEELLSKVYNNFENYNNYIIETFCENEIFDNINLKNIKINYNGMIFSLSNRAKLLISEARKKNLFPYIGITFE